MKTKKIVAFMLSLVLCCSCVPRIATVDNGTSISASAVTLTDVNLKKITYHEDGSIKSFEYTYIWSKSNDSDSSAIL